MKSHSYTFSRRLPDSRLGKQHQTLDSFRRVVNESGLNVQGTKEYTLIVVTETQPQVESQTSTRKSDGTPNDNFISCVENTRILLGLKNRGFGRGYYNSFGGKFLNEEETVEACACRELEEETNLKVHLHEMAKSKVGIQRYTFENDPVEMIMHLFRIKLEKTEHNVGGCHNVTECDEITPKWFDDMSTIPFDNMFADDSLWLPMLLSSDTPLEINGWYHFQENCQETNTILHYHMDIQNKVLN
mmetsp:Transcript_11446/g.32941  ORF Transcript_11446/g.32941 Transcript_11446/m.32941 type:complete len:244 (+) Transcript_11446:147-878(+)|eukprot:CAMPEP_0172366886 /NCGR_PEP_ID=MMETSP1060-20121228/17616_1 /TAXON_ID=37318 /ORGANISM="Pseudo-nitzschia pungens, Strain cf. cingulata" /LENGTH=243 /DNA_ID=CAMNT_0013090915 /DNA_START=86 /DNA_END=817 /DNA_ORIENTATION=-